MKTSTLLMLLFIVGLVIGAFYSGYQFNNKPVEYRTDTITITDLDTFTLIKPIPVLITKDTTIIDTLMSIDSILIPVNIPLSKYEFADTLFKDSTSVELYQTLIGYRVSIEKTTMRLKSTSTVIYPVIVPSKPKKFSVGPYFGFGLNNGKIVPEIGIGFTINLIQF